MSENDVRKIILAKNGERKINITENEEREIKAMWGLRTVYAKYFLPRTENVK